MEWIHREDPSYPLSSSSVIINENVSDNTLKTRLVRVDVVDANHCPGSCMFLFTLYDLNELKEPQGSNNSEEPTQSSSLNASNALHFELFYRVLYTGDFRYDPHMLDEGVLSQFCDGSSASLDLLMVDNTYNQSIFNFPPQQCVINTAAHILNKYWKQQLHPVSDLVVLIDSYHVGKENLWLHLSNTFDLPVYVDKYESMINLSRREREARIQCYEDFDRLYKTHITTNQNDTP